MGPRQGRVPIWQVACWTQYHQGKLTLERFPIEMLEANSATTNICSMHSTDFLATAATL
jgi:hypothetical protein